MQNKTEKVRLDIEKEIGKKREKIRQEGLPNKRSSVKFRRAKKRRIERLCSLSLFGKVPGERRRRKRERER